MAKAEIFRVGGRYLGKSFVESQFDPNKMLSILYKNHRGQVEIREITPIEVVFTTTAWHEGEQWFLRAICWERQAERMFAMCDIMHMRPVETETDDI